MDFFDYFQIGFLAVFYITFLGRTIQLYTSGIKPFVLGAGKKGIKAFIEITFFVGLIIWTFEIISHSLKLEYHIFHGALYYIFFSIFFLKVLGIAVIFVGYILFVWSLISFGESWRVGIDTQNPGNLIINGAFSFSRNPIFLFMDLYFLGTWLIYSNAFFLIFFYCSCLRCALPDFAGRRIFM